MVHGGIGDRTRWSPMIPCFSSRFTACAMDRRGHGASGDSPDYTLQKEAEDVAAVVNSRPGTVFVLGHSYGGVCALEATFLTERISKLVLYETALAGPHRRYRHGQNREDDSGWRARAGRGDHSCGSREAFAERSGCDAVAAVLARVRGYRRLAPSSDACTRGPIDSIAARMSSVRMPTLLVTGSDTASPQLKQAIDSLRPPCRIRPCWCSRVSNTMRWTALARSWPRRSQPSARYH